MSRTKRRPPALLILAILAAMVVLYFYGGNIDLRAGLDALSQELDRWIQQLDPSLQEPFEIPDSSPLSEDALDVSILQVGQADAILIQCGGQSLLLDAGESQTSDYVCDYIEDQGITKLDCVICTHPHTDHIGAMADVIEMFEPETCYVSPREHTTLTYEKLLDALEEYEVETIIPDPGDAFTLGGAQIEFLAPLETDYEEINDCSLVCMITYQDRRLLFTGDAQSDSESDMLDQWTNLNADFLKVGHHGSATSSSAAFIEAVSPAYACITRDQLDEISPVVIERLEAVGAKIFYTYYADVLVRVENGVLSCQYAQ